ncbi:hypothetical protein [Paracoccus sp. M683]|uniref:hypothetical protein n=2 Tax=Paracoccus TaxID=265 RepID=UPI00163D9EA5|nr:hypothetical protein [Paracoccus sp. M683]
MKAKSPALLALLAAALLAACTPIASDQQLDGQAYLVQPDDSPRLGFNGFTPANF